MLRADGGLVLLRKQFGLKALTVIAPSVKGALIKHNQEDGGKVSNVFLPEASEAAYELIFDRADAVIEAGNLIPFAEVQKAAVYQYFNVLVISTALQIEFLTSDLEERYTQKLGVTRTSAFKIDKKSIIEAYNHRKECFNLCDDIASAIATAIRFDVLEDSDKTMVEKLKKKLPELAGDLDKKLES